MGPRLFPTVVTVAIPTYNPGPYLREAVESILSQTVWDWELFISDDSSTDVGVDFVRDLMRRDPRIRYVRNSPRLGLVRNFTQCTRLGSGRYVTIFHQDDVMLPTNLAAKVAMLEAQPGVGMVYSNVEGIDEAGNVFPLCWDPNATTDTILSRAHFVRRMIAEGNLVCAPTVMIRRSVVMEVGPFDPRLPWTCDWDMWIRIGLKHDVGVIATPQIRWRIHDGQESSSYNFSLRGLQQVCQLYEILFSERAPNLKSDRELRIAAMRYLTRHGRRAFWEAWKRGRRWEAVGMAGFTVVRARQYLARAAYRRAITRCKVARDVARWVLGLKRGQRPVAEGRD